MVASVARGRGMVCALACLIALCGCERGSRIKIAVIPRTTGAMIWEPEHGGAQTAALSGGARIYWNAPTREDDIEGQIALVQRVSAQHYDGILLSPDQSRALITPVRRAMQRGIPVVVIGSPLPMEANSELSYVLNDEEAGARMAAERVEAMLHCEGTIAILGINRDIAGIVMRAQAVERFLATSCPSLRLVKRDGSFNTPHEQQVAEETLRVNPDIKAVIALTGTSTSGALSAVKNLPSANLVRVVGFDPDTMGFDNPNLDSLVIEDTRAMGAEGVRRILGRIRMGEWPALTRITPVLATRENAESPRIRQLTSMNWSPEPQTPTWRLIR
ncbi:MAG TPA: substrate-binding domain-containing protein [Acidobacteriaceae bacterium]|nr:substrate-binding domain-containing protein [Acidobacteriaceae bacterium]